MSSLFADAVGYRSPGFLQQISFFLLTSALLGTPNALLANESDARWYAGESFAHYLPGGGLQGVWDLGVDGTTVVVPEADEGLYFYDLTVPGELVDQAYLPTKPGTVAFDDSFVYATNWETNEFFIVDASSANDPQIRGTIANLSARDLAVQGDYVYALSGQTLRVISVANPDAPSVVGTLGGGSQQEHISIDGSTAFVSRSGSIRTVDISDPTNPIDGTPFFAEDTVYDLLVSDGYLYAAQTSVGLRVFELSSSDPPALVATVPFIGAERLAGNQSWILVGSGEATLIVDVSNPVAPAPGATFRGVAASGGFVRDGFAYLGAYEDGVQVLELRSGTGPSVVSSHPAWANGKDLQLYADDQLALLTPTAFALIDVSNPDLPSLISTVPLSFPQAMAVGDGYAFVTDADGLKVLSLIDPESPEVFAFLGGILGEEMQRVGDRLYTATINALVQVIDVSDPADPILLASDPLSFAIEGLAVIGTDVFVAQNFEGVGFVSGFDYTTPSSPVGLGKFYSRGITELGVNEGTVVAGGPFELSILTPALDLVEQISDHDFASRAMARSEDGFFYTVNEHGGFHVFAKDFETTGSLRYQRTGATPHVAGLGILPVDDRLYVTDFEGLHVYDRGTEVAAVPTPTEIARLRHDRLLAFPNPSSGAIVFQRKADVSAASHRASSHLVAAHGMAREDGSAAVDSGEPLEIFTADGTLIRTIAATPTPSTRWDGRDDRGNAVSPGVYFARWGQGASAPSTSIRIVR